MGEAAKTLETSNYKNTVGNLKRLAGRKLNDPVVTEVESKFVTANLIDVEGVVGVKVHIPILSLSSAPTYVLLGIHWQRIYGLGQLSRPNCTVFRQSARRDVSR